MDEEDDGGSEHDDEDDEDDESMSHSSDYSSGPEGDGLAGDLHQARLCFSLL